MRQLFNFYEGQPRHESLLHRRVRIHQDAAVAGPVAVIRNARQVDLPGLKAGTYTLDYDTHTPPRPAEYEKLAMRQMKAVNSKAKIEKYRVQLFFEDELTTEDVEAFNRFKLPIFVRAFYDAFPPIVRKRIDLALKLMRPKGDDFQPNYELSEKILDTLELMGFKNMGADEQEKDLQNMPDDASKGLNEKITAIRTAALVRGSEASDPIQAFRGYISKIWEYKLKYHKRQKGNKKYSTYSMVSVVPEGLLANMLYFAQWLEAHCKAVDRFLGAGHDERILIESALVEFKSHETRAVNLVPNPKRKRGD
ncbi:unnamed protein product [Ectocarpus sp. 8 AP-2014]